MSDVTLTYKGATIAELNASGNKTLKTSGKYCDADIQLEYVKSGGSAIVPPLPSTYQQLEYLENGEDDTKVKVSLYRGYSSITFFVVKVKGTNNSRGVVAGIHSVAEGSVAWNENIKQPSQQFVDYNSQMLDTSWNYTWYDPNGPMIAVFRPTARETDFYLGGWGGGDNWFDGKIYYLYVVSPVELAASKTLLCALIPCYRKSDGVNGFYDTVNNTFYTAISGSFTRGPEVH